jgi:hypothetical protein
MNIFKKLLRKLMGIFRSSTSPKASNPPQDNIDRGDDVVGPVPIEAPRRITNPGITFSSLTAGSVLTAIPAVWATDNSTTFSRQWFKDGVAIAGETNLTYIIRAGDVGADITVRDSATNVVGTTVSTSSPVVPTEATGVAPTVDTIPTLFAPQYRAGYIVVASGSAFTGADDFEAFWTRDNIVIPGATGSNYLLTEADVGKLIRNVVRASNEFGSVDAVSNPTIAILPREVSSVPQTEFDFTQSSTAPTGVTVARSGGAGTYFDINGVVQEAPANTPRITHVGGAVKGLYVEKERTNIFPWGRHPFSGSWSDLGTGVVKTTNYSTSPDGDTDGAGRLQIPAGSGYRGVRYQLANAAGLPLLKSFWAKSNASGTVYLGNYVSAWGLIQNYWDYYASVQAAEANKQIDIVAGDGSAVDVSMWGIGLYPGGKMGESIILTNGTEVTRPKEVVTFDLGITGIRDIRVTFTNGNVQDFLNQNIVDVWVLDADAITGENNNIVKKVNVYGAGQIPGSTPPPPPPPPPGSGSSGTMPLADLISGQTLASSYLPYFPSGGNHNMQQANMQSPNYDALAGMCVERSSTLHNFFDEILPWFWVYPGAGHNANKGLRLQYRNGIISILRKSTNQWVTFYQGNQLDGYLWYENKQVGYNGQPGPVFSMDVGLSKNDAGGTRSIALPMGYGVELWIPGVRNRELALDCKAVACMVECRMVDANGNPYNGADGTYSTCLGFDQYGRSRGGGFKQSNPYGPGIQMDGGASRWRQVTGGYWRPVGLITMESYKKNGNVFTDWSSYWKYEYPPYVLTEAQVLDNPPIWTT